MCLVSATSAMGCFLKDLADNYTMPSFLYQVLETQDTLVEHEGEGDNTMFECQFRFIEYEICGLQTTYQHQKY